MNPVVAGHHYHFIHDHEWHLLFKVILNLSSFFPQSAAVSKPSPLVAENKESKPHSPTTQRPSQHQRSPANGLSQASVPARRSSPDSCFSHTSCSRSTPELSGDRTHSQSSPGDRAGKDTPSCTSSPSILHPFDGPPQTVFTSNEAQLRELGCKSPLDGRGSDSLLDESGESFVSDLISDFSLLSDSSSEDSSWSHSPWDVDSLSVEEMEMVDAVSSSKENCVSMALDSRTVARKSQRRRRQSQKYESVNFLQSPRRRSESQAEKVCVGTAEPRGSPLSADADFAHKKHHFESLLGEKLGSLRAKKEEERRRVRQRQAEERAQKLAERRRLEKERVESRERLRCQKQEMRAVLCAVREEARLVQREQAQRERERRRTELEELKLKKSAEKKRRKEVMCVTPCGQSFVNECQLPFEDDDSPEGCLGDGIPDLPVCPDLGLPVAGDVIPSLVFVSEFLYNFSRPLKIKKRLLAGELSHPLMDTPPTHTHVYVL